MENKRVMISAASMAAALSGGMAATMRKVMEGLVPRSYRTRMRYFGGWSPDREAKKKKYYESRPIKPEHKDMLTLRRARMAAQRVKRFTKNFTKKNGRHPHAHEVPRHIRDKMMFVHTMKAALDALQEQKGTANA